MINFSKISKSIIFDWEITVTNQWIYTTPR